MPRRRVPLPEQHDPRANGLSQGSGDWRSLHFDHVRLHWWRCQCLHLRRLHLHCLLLASIRQGVGSGVGPREGRTLIAVEADRWEAATHEGGWGNRKLATGRVGAASQVGRRTRSKGRVSTETRHSCRHRESEPIIAQTAQAVLALAAVACAGAADAELIRRSRRTPGRHIGHEKGQVGVAWRRISTTTAGVVTRTQGQRTDSDRAVQPPHQVPNIALFGGAKTHTRGGP